MFYSSSLISQKGGLKSIWVAAFCHKKLKKSQVAKTNISSSVEAQKNYLYVQTQLSAVLLPEKPKEYAFQADVTTDIVLLSTRSNCLLGLYLSSDEIIQNEATVTYRVLGYLLLGVVRIYSKQVEYLYHDSNNVLTQMNTWAPLKKPMEDMCAPYSLITLPERFELDTFVLDFPEDDNSGHVANHQLITLEDIPEESGFEIYSLNKDHCYHEEDLTRFEISIDAGTPVRDILSPQAMDAFMAMDTSHELTRAEASMEKLQSIQLSREEFVDFNKSPGANESMDVEVDRIPKQITFLEITPPDPGKPSSPTELTRAEASMEKLQSIQLSGEGFVDFNTIPGANESMDVECREFDRRPEHIKFLEITPPDPRKLGSPTGEVAAADQEARVPNGKDSGAPELMVIHTPSKKEPPRFIRKRKCLYDETVVLSNKVMRQSIHDASDLVAKRTSSPVTSLDVWKAHKLPKLYQDFLEPLLPCAPQIGSLFRKRFMSSPQIVTSLREKRTRKRRAAERVQSLEPREVAMMSGEDICEPQSKFSQERAHSIESPEEGRQETHREAPEEGTYETHRGDSEERDHRVESTGSPSRSKDSRQEKDRELTLERADSRDPLEGGGRSVEHEYDAHSKEGAYSEKITLDESTCFPVDIPTTTNVDMAAAPFTLLPGNDDIEMNLIDENLHQEDVLSENQNGWSARTRTVADFLSKSFQKRKEHDEGAVTLNLNPILEGKTRKENARIFYEILVLKSRGFVNVKQDEPYGDISLVMAAQSSASG